MLDDNSLTGTVLRIERSSIHDGYGFRTVIFLKGCPFSCLWCSTPESQSFDIEYTNDTVYGSIMTVEQVMREVRKDSLFYFHSGGGLTLSGGEPLAQLSFTEALLKNAKLEGINTAIETTFNARWEDIEAVLNYINLLFVDIKMLNDKRHMYYCGGSNEQILQNLLNTNKISSHPEIIVRIPIIPGVNDSEKDMKEIGKFSSNIQKLSAIQLLPYHRLGVTTYKKLGREYAFPHMTPPDEDTIGSLKKALSTYVEKVL